MKSAASEPHEVGEGCLDCPHPDYCAGMGKCEIGAAKLAARSAAIKRVHATEPPAWWCAGVFSPVPVRFVGLGHAASPRRQGWPIHHCETCGEDLFIEYEVDPKIPSWEEVAARVPA